MTRKTARAIAARLCFAVGAGADAGELLETVFEPAYYHSLKEEDELFGEYPDEAQKRYIVSLVNGIGQHNAELDSYVEKYSRGWKFSRISRTALAIMKTAMYEILYLPEIPNGVAINEAVELAKEYEEQETVRFVNGILGSFVRNEAQGIETDHTGL